mgnify:FL=1
MKTIKALTDFGIMDVQTIGTKKEIRGQFWICAKVPMQYMNSKEPLILTRVLHYSTGTNLPLRGISYKATAKCMLNEAEAFFDNMKLTPEMIKKELSNFNQLNN